MSYQKQAWRDYDDTKTELQNLQNGAVVTPERMNHIETGIANSADKEEVTAQLAQTEREKVGGGVKAEPEDLSERTLGLVTGQGTINIESIPQNKSVTPIKTDFVIESRNLYNKDTSVDYKRLDGSDSLERNSSDYITVQGNTTYVSSHYAELIVYGETFNQIGGTQFISPTRPLTTTSSARFVRVSPSVVDKDNFQFEEGDTVTTFQPYGLFIPDLIIEGLVEYMTTENEEWII